MLRDYLSTRIFLLNGRGAHKKGGEGYNNDYGFLFLSVYCFRRGSQIHNDLMIPVLNFSRAGSCFSISHCNLLTFALSTAQTRWVCCSTGVHHGCWGQSVATNRGIGTRRRIFVHISLVKGSGGPSRHLGVAAD